MGFVVIVSLPLILFILILALACYLLGRARGRTGRPPAPQYFGPTAPPVQPQFPPQDYKPSQSQV